MVPLVETLLPLVPLVVANVTIGGNVGTNGTIGMPNGTIGRPNGVKSNIMINTSNLFLYSYFLCVYFSISITCEYHPDKNSAYLYNL